MVGFTARISASRPFSETDLTGPEEVRPADALPLYFLLAEAMNLPKAALSEALETRAFTGRRCAATSWRPEERREWTPSFFINGKRQRRPDVPIFGLKPGCEVRAWSKLCLTLGPPLTEMRGSGL
jgi:hypothetical protein